MPDVKEKAEQKSEERKEATSAFGIPEEEVMPFCLWIKNELQPVVNKVSISKRLTSSPAVVSS